MFLCLFAGGQVQQLPKGLTGEEGSEEQHEARFDKQRQRYKDLRGKPLKKSRVWILEKKERWRNKGKDVRADSKYTGRKRPKPF